MIKIVTLIIFILNISFAQAQESNISEKQALNKIIKTIKNKNKNNKIALYLSQKYGDDEEVMNELLKTNGLLLEHASTRLRKNKDLVLTAVRENGLALEYAYHALKNDEEVVLTAASENIEALEFTSNNFMRDKEFLLNILTNYNH